MKSLNEWRIKEGVQNIEWNNIKSMRFPVEPDVKSFILPKVEKIQEAIVLKLSQNNPNIKTFRDVPPELRDKFAQAIVSSTMEAFFNSLNQPSQIQPQVQQQQSPQQAPLPQDELRTPSISRG